jgi:hypothetical protein
MIRLTGKAGLALGLAFRYAVIIVMCLMVYALPVRADHSTLHTAATNLAAGSWVELSTTNIVTALGGTSGASGFTFGYTDQMVWDHVGHKGYFIGSDHAACDTGSPRFVQFDEATNTWSILSSPGWFPTNLCSGGTAMHGYHHTAIDWIGRKLYHRPYNNMTVQSYNLTSGTWSALTTIGIGSGASQIGYNSCCVGLSFLPWMGSHGWLLYHSAENGANGTTLRWDPNAATWSTPTGWNESMTTGDPHNIVECAIVSRTCIMGGGNGNADVWRVTARETITAGTDAFQSYGINTSITTHDPVTGKFLFLWGPSTWREYDAVANSWTTMGGTASVLSAPNHTGGNPVHGVVAMPLYDYGVIMFPKCVSSSSCTVWLYRHTASDEATRRFYADQCLQPGVIMCHGYDSPIEFTGSTREGVNYVDTTGGSTPTRDTSVKAAGVSSIKMTVPANSGANSSGSVHDNFRDDLTRQKTQNETLYVMFRVYYSCDFLFTSCPSATGTRSFSGGGGWKVAIIGTGDRSGDSAFSCTDLETVIQNTVHRGLPQMYRSCAGPFAFNPLDEPFNAGSNFYWQNNIRATTSSGCFYPSTTTGCWKFTANEWLTFKAEIKVSNPWYNSGGTFLHNGIVRLWAGRDGDSSGTLLLDFSQKGSAACDGTQSYIPSCQTGLDFWRSTTAPDSSDTFGKVWLLPYNTGKSSGETNPEATIYYDNLIVSDSDIAWPGQASSSGSTAPVAPTNVRIVEAVPDMSPPTVLSRHEAD